MMNLLSKKRKKLVVWIAAVAAVLVAMIIFCAAYVSDYYRADAGAINAFVTDYTVEKQVLADDTIIYGPEDAKTGFIFYPGGKVEYSAYEPLIASLASEGIFCALVKMPFNLAVLDMNAADDILAFYPNIENWYIGGHSLGGTMAASYVSKHTDAFDGLILLGSYSTADLSKTSLKVLSVYGSEDRVLNQENYEKNKDNLPKSFTEIRIEGGCHAYFGMYGAQEGDGVPTIRNEEQIAVTVEQIHKILTK